MLGKLKRKLFDPKKALMKVLGDVELPTFPAVVTQALDQLRDENVSVRKIGETIADDPGLSVRLLRVANSAMYSLRHPARTVPHAVSLLGRGEVESLLLGVAVGSALPANDPAFDAGAFWRAAGRRATIARELARVLHPTTQSESFTTALLQDMAVPLLVSHRRDEYTPVLTRWHDGGGDLAQLEREHFGWDHAEVAMLLCTQWGFPEALTEAIAGHHGNGSGDSSAPLAVLLVSELDDRGDEQALERLVDRAVRECELSKGQAQELVAAGLEAADAVSAQFGA